tara:strand:- start:310 stop:558 length:249 start_codon:yes stop_codon:yes gene_type:complete
MFKKINKMMGAFLKEENKDFSFFEKTKKNWKKKLPEKITKNAQIIDYTDGVLTIKAKNPSWKNELIFFVEEIKKNFRQKKIK